jgi:hypothetical protein
MRSSRFVVAIYCLSPSCIPLDHDGIVRSVLILVKADVQQESRGRITQNLGDILHLAQEGGKLDRAFEVPRLDIPVLHAYLTLEPLVLKPDRAHGVPRPARTV